MTLDINLHFSHPELHVQLTCPTGALTAILGPSGSGKSTLLRAIAGLNQNCSGRIAVGDTLWLNSATQQRRATRARRCGMVMQDYALFPHLTALDNIAMALRDLPSRRRLAEARHWLHRVGLKGLEQRRPDALSGGQQQRVALARALARRPEVLLLDEPFSAVDSRTRERLYEELSLLRADLAMPTLLVTHDLREATLLADHIAILAHGHTLQTGPTAQVLGRPADPRVARVIGYKNLFRGQIVAIQASGSLLEWRGQRLWCTQKHDFSLGSEIVWSLPNSAVRVASQHVSLGNRVSGKIIRLARLADQMSIQLAIAERTPPLFLTTPMDIVNQHGWQVGSTIHVSLPAEALHIMPPDIRTPTEG